MYTTSVLPSLVVCTAWHAALHMEEDSDGTNGNLYVRNCCNHKHNRSNSSSDPHTSLGLNFLYSPGRWLAKA
jgi:hypothetical protein